MRTRVQIDELSESDVRQLVRNEVAEALAPVMAAVDEIRLAAPVLSHPQLARFLEVASETVLGWIRSGALPASKQGRTYYVAKADLHEWQMSNRAVRRPK